MAGGYTEDGDVKGGEVPNEGGRFVMAVVEIVTGKPIATKTLRGDLETIAERERKRIKPAD